MLAISMFFASFQVKHNDVKTRRQLLEVGTTSMWWTASQPHFSLFLLVQRFKPEICEAYLSREEFHREKHYDFCSKQVPLWCLQMFVISRTLRRLSTLNSKKLDHAFKGSMTFDIATQVLSVYTTFPRFLFPLEDHRGKARQVKTQHRRSWRQISCPQELRRVRSPMEEPGANADRTPPGSAAPPPVAVGAPRWESMVPHTHR